MAKARKAKKAKSKVKRRPAVKRKTKAKKRKSGAKRKSGLSQQMYSLSPELAEVCGSKRLTRPHIVKKLWVYIKAHKCQDTKNRRLIVPDHKLSAVIGKKPVDMMKLAGHLNKHISK
jgi:chromatin remodeling complex protein RSC6